MAFMPAQQGVDALAARGTQPHRPGRRDGPAVARPFGRPRAAGPCRRMHRAGAADAARDLAGDGRWRPPDHDRADARRPVVAARPLALLPGPSLLDRPARGPAARQHVRAAAADPRALTCRRPGRGWPCAWRRPSSASASAGSAASPASASSRRASSSMPASPSAAEAPSSPSCGPSSRSPARATRRCGAQHRRRRSAGFLMSFPSRADVALTARDRAAGLWRGRIGHRARPLHRGRLAWTPKPGDNAPRRVIAIDTALDKDARGTTLGKEARKLDVAIEATATPMPCARPTS